MITRLSQNPLFLPFQEDYTNLNRQYIPAGGWGIDLCNGITPPYRPPYRAPVDIVDGAAETPISTTAVQPLTPDSHPPPQVRPPLHRPH